MMMMMMMTMVEKNRKKRRRREEHSTRKLKNDLRKETEREGERGKGDEKELVITIMIIINSSRTTIHNEMEGYYGYTKQAIIIVFFV